MWIDLDKSSKGYDVEAYPGVFVSRLPKHDGSEEKLALEREMSKVLEKVGWTEGRRRLSIDDLNAMRMALEAAFRIWSV